MFGIEALDVVIGMIFIYLLFSLFVTIVNEIVSAFFGFKGKHLYTAISQFISEADLKELKEDPRIQLLLKKNTDPNNKTDITKKNFPDEIPADIFAEILFANREKLNSYLKNNLISSKKELVKHYDLIVLQAKNTYKKNVRLVVLILSLIISVGFNVDSISIFQELSKNPEKAAAIANSASKYIALNDSLDFSASDSASIDAMMLKIKKLNNNQLEDIDATLGSIGWDCGKPFCSESSWLKFVGWLISALALSLGAPFWFDLLKKVVNIKNELKPKEKSNES